MIAYFRHGIGTAGHFPAAKMLGADRESEKGREGGLGRLGMTGGGGYGVREY